MKRGKRTRDGFQFEPEVRSDLFAGHPQAKLGGRETAGSEALGKVEQKRGKALFGAHRAQKGHYPLFAHDLARQHFVELGHQRGNLLGERFELRVFDHADFTVFERNRGDRVASAADAVEPEELPGHLKPGDLFAAVREGEDGFERAKAHGIERFERGLAFEQGLVAFHPFAYRDQGVELFEVVCR